MLKRIGSINLPPHATGGFDHADVHKQSGKVYIAHTANGSVEVVDGAASRHILTIAGCAEASGVLCAQEEGLVFAAARGAGKILVIDCNGDETIKEVLAGFRPNGLAWDTKRKQLLAADVGDNKARLLDPESGRNLGELALRGRPRWTLYDYSSDLFLVSIKDPPGVELISPGSFSEEKFVPVSAQGPHGLGVVEGTGKAFVACDARTLVALNFSTGRRLGQVPLSGGPDVLWTNPAKNRLYCAIGSPGVIDVFDMDKLVQSEKVITEEGAHTITFDVTRQRLYALMPTSGCVTAYSED